MKISNTSPKTCNFENQTLFYRPEFLEVLVRDLLKEDSIENNQINVKGCLDAIVSVSETMLRELAGQHNEEGPDGMEAHYHGA